MVELLSCRRAGWLGWLEGLPAGLPAGWFQVNPPGEPASAGGLVRVLQLAGPAGRPAGCPPALLAGWLARAGSVAWLLVSQSQADVPPERWRWGGMHFVCLTREPWAIV